MASEKIREEARRREKRTRKGRRDKGEEKSKRSSSSAEPKGRAAQQDSRRCDVGCKRTISAHIVHKLYSDPSVITREMGERSRRG